MTAAAVMTLLKLAAGLMSGSLGVLSDAAHSGLDLAGAALTFFSVQVSDKPADEDHTYGHGKIENLSAFTEAGLMAVSCAWIIWEAIQRIFYRSVELHHSLWPVAGAGRLHRRGFLALAAVACGGRAHRFARAWPRMPSTSLQTSGPRWPCWPDWAQPGRERVSALARCTMLTRAPPLSFRS